MQVVSLIAFGFTVVSARSSKGADTTRLTLARAKIMEEKESCMIFKISVDVTGSVFESGDYKFLRDEVAS